MAEVLCAVVRRLKDVQMFASSVVANVHVSDNCSGTEHIGKISDTELHILRIIGIHLIVKAEANVDTYFASWTTVAVEK
jgi:hypothetical protein